MFINKVVYAFLKSLHATNSDDLAKSVFCQEADGVLHFFKNPNDYSICNKWPSANAALFEALLFDALLDSPLCENCFMNMLDDPSWFPLNNNMTSDWFNTALDSIYGAVGFLESVGQSVLIEPCNYNWRIMLLNFKCMLRLKQDCSSLLPSFINTAEFSSLCEAFSVLIDYHRVSFDEKDMSALYYLLNIELGAYRVFQQVSFPTTRPADFSSSNVVVMFQKPLDSYGVLSSIITALPLVFPKVEYGGSRDLVFAPVEFVKLCNSILDASSNSAFKVAGFVTTLGILEPYDTSEVISLAGDLFAATSLDDSLQAARSMLKK